MHKARPLPQVLNEFDRSPYSTFSFRNSAITIILCYVSVFCVRTYPLLYIYIIIKFISASRNHVLLYRGQLTPPGNSSSNILVVVLVLRQQRLTFMATYTNRHSLSWPATYTNRHSLSWPATQANRNSTQGPATQANRNSTQLPAEGLQVAACSTSPCAHCSS